MEDSNFFVCVLVFCIMFYIYVCEFVELIVLIVKYMF